MALRRNMLFHNMFLRAEFWLHVMQAGTQLDLTENTESKETPE